MHTGLIISNLLLPHIKPKARRPTPEDFMLTSADEIRKKHASGLISALRSAASKK